MEVDWKSLSAFGVVLAAIVGGLFGILPAWLNRQSAKLSAEIARDNARLQAKLTANVKLAEFRQRWIDCLREDMAKFGSLGVTPDLDHNSMQEFYELGTRIELRMNPNDENFAELQDCMYAFLGAELIEEKFAANPRFVRICQEVLKREWDVLCREVREVHE